ncbi:hypothetical protein ACIQ34_10190 [Ureibacillus sp. NPDC094379]
MIKRTAIVLFSCVLLMGCSSSNFERNTEIEKDLHSSIIMVSDQSDSQVSIKNFVKFEWDKAFLIQPYTPEDDIEKQVGVKFKDPSNMDKRDDIYLLIFLNQEKVVQYAEIERLGTTITLGDQEYLTPSNDVMYIER